MLTLRPYQKEPVRKAIDYFREENPDPSLMVLPTGAGKSVIAAEVAAACPDPILVVQPTKELLEQNLEKYRTLCGELAPAGVYSTSFGKHQIDHVTFATIGSIKTIGTQFRQLGFRKMLIDEAHLYPRKEQSMLGAFLRDSGIRQVLGMTATPLKLENFSVKYGEKYNKWSELIMLTNLSPSGTFFKRIIHVTQIQELTALGYWSPLRYEVLPFSRDHLEMNSAGSEYSDESVITAYEYNNIRANILAALDYHRERRHILVFVPSVEEAEALASFYPSSAAVSGTTPKKERQRIIDEFRSGNIRVVFNVNVLSTGFDYPEIDMIVTGFSTASMAKYYQVLGRGVRIHPDKKDCIIVEAGGNYQKFGKVEDLQYEWDGKWRMFGSGDCLISGIPVQCIGTVGKADVALAYSSTYAWETVDFGKHKGKPYSEVPPPYLAWLLQNPSPYRNLLENMHMRACAVRAIENHLRDTRNDPPVTVFPDGKYAGENMGFAPRGYLTYYYNSKEWNETNDSLRRGIEILLNKH